MTDLTCAPNTSLFRTRSSFIFQARDYHLPPLDLGSQLVVTWRAQGSQLLTLEYWRWLKPAHRIVDGSLVHSPNSSALLNSCNKHEGWVGRVGMLSNTFSTYRY